MQGNVYPLRPGSFHVLNEQDERYLRRPNEGSGSGERVQMDGGYTPAIITYLISTYSSMP
jgi:hypothetical protein